MTTSSDDMRILDDIALEISVHKMSWLPGSMRKLIKGVRAKRIAATLEDVARKRVDAEWSLKQTAQRMQAEIDGLRDDIQRLTDAALGKQ